MSSKGRVCGGFASVSWKSEGNYVEDDQACLFSVDLEKKYPVNSVWHRADFGPCFGRKGELQANAKVPMKAGDCMTRSEFPENKIHPDPEGNSPLTGEKKNFVISELEVFKIIY
jgi:hypothetical protein